MTHRKATGLIIVTIVLWLVVLTSVLGATVKCGTFESSGARYGFCVAKGI